jgi:hypothetical protein
MQQIIGGCTYTVFFSFDHRNDPVVHILCHTLMSITAPSFYLPYHLCREATAIQCSLPKDLPMINIQLRTDVGATPTATPFHYCSTLTKCSPGCSPCLKAGSEQYSLLAWYTGMAEEPIMCTSKPSSCSPLMHGRLAQVAMGLKQWYTASQAASMGRQPARRGSRGYW